VDEEELGEEELDEEELDEGGSPAVVGLEGGSPGVVLLGRV
jgi:hypothetical protein